ncbi:sigma-70 factor domain-containing protein [Streptomyces sp. WM6372]|uniref:sigma-70 factor domain-containing protein n=1 Tax=Streptomyces sp. WM6372 TaxID=1415555 RepID=UPI000AC674D5
MSASTSRTLPPEIADSESVMALIERGKAEGQIAGDDVRRAFEADQIPATQWKNVLRSLNQILEEEGVTLMVSAAESPKRTTRKSVAAKTPAKRTATKTVAAKTAAAQTVAAAAPAAETVDPEQPVDAPAEEPGTEPAAKKTAAKKTAAKKAAPAKKTAAKKTAAKKTAAKKDADEAGEEETSEEGPGAVKAEAEEEEDGGESKGFVISDDEDDAPAQQVAVAGATADPVKDYLKQIGKVPLLNAEQEVELAKRIEAGLFAEDKLANSDKLAPKLKRELEIIAEDGRRTTCWRPTSASWSRWPSATRAAACSSWT